jgi:catechol 2,3-dioxygenase-like lactoylglutathione lyase family enzyme
LIEGAVLDHVAIAVERWSDAFPRFVGELGGEWCSGEQAMGFAPAQIAFANEMRVELIAPHRADLNDFLRRFIDRHGAGAHHLTFKVPDFGVALAEARAAGLEPINVDDSDPHWKEAFLHPAQASGIVVQLAQAAPVEGDSWRTPAPEGFPMPSGPRATLTHITHGVADLDRARRLFRDLLAGRETGSGAGWTELAWPGPGRLRLVQVDDLDGRAGRLQHLAFSVQGPSRELPPDAATGTRLVLTHVSDRP